MEPHQDWTPFEAPPSFLSVLSSFAHFLIPLYAIFLYEAPISLRIWLAMKAAERGDFSSSTGEFKKNDTNENLNPNRIPWTGRVIAALRDSTLLIEIMKLLVFVAVIIDIVLTSFRVEVSMKNTVYFALMFIPAGAACVKLYRILWLPSEIRVERNREIISGFSVTQTWDEHMGLLHTLGCSAFAVSLPINAFLTRSGPAVNIILAIMLHPLLRSVATTTKSQSVKAFTSRTGALGIAAVVVVIGFYIMDEQLRVDFTTSADKKLDRKWMKWIFSLMMSPLSFSYIVFFLRLDYALSNHNDGPTSALQTPEKGEGGSSDGKRNRGILVPPASCFTSLRKPYYTASWLGYVAAAFCLALLCSVPISKGLPLIKLDDCDSTIGFYLAFIAPTLMCTFVIILAFFRGEFGRVWNYEDKWTVRGKGSKETDHA